MKKRNVILLAGLFCSSVAATQAQSIKPYGALPSKAQLAWQDMEYYMFIHFGPNTFTDKEWGHGDEDPKVFNPSQLDARQWARTAKLAGMKGIVLTAKHHDGFCLWPSKYSTHTVRESAWKNGKGDVLAELSAACKEYGLKFGVYLSPWDRNHPEYGTPTYNQVFANTLTEVLSNYGPVFEQWFDGANGETEGGRKQVYDWPLFHSVVYKHQPNAVIFSDVGPGCRWVGNENGIAGTTNWSTLNVEGFAPGAAGPPAPVLNTGNEDGEKWVPAESDVSIRPGWFYSPATDDKVKTLPHLLDIYYGSVGRNSNLILNVPIDRRGLIHANDSIRLMELKKNLDATFKTNLAKGAKVTASNVRKDKGVLASHLTDGNNKTYWATEDNVQQATITLDLKQPVTFNRFLVSEYIALGQRVKAFTVEVWDGSGFKEVARETTVGHKRILRLPNITTSRVRINILDAKACPVLTEVQLFKAPEVLTTPEIKRNKAGEVTITAASADPVLYYTLDGSEPTVSSARYTGAISLPAGGVVKAKAFINNGKTASNTVVADFDVAPARWSIVHKDGEAGGHEAEKAIDGNADTYWASHKKGQGAAYPHELQVDLGESLLLKGFTYVPRRDNQSSGNIQEYAFYVSEDGKNWGQAAAAGAFDNIRNNPVKQTIRFKQPVKGRFVKLVAKRATNEADEWASVAELGVVTK